ncbi:hypothetical protein ACFQHV_20360 [Promicromonospora thailandica]|uniref:Uncharacterized protein n=1 Tax=Promicromonospora thailandica TaxID=765201 RepID=A0A9X2JUK6_9MICO|nr:hypothetical protein [Promicromonospora thailandica]MCP2264121.1 hypothetical protein [Promicromonospora thailandica]BFF21217.1 hypothetical protein GCM10025730_47380 [Promicromonospora thailandica]
MTSAQQAQPRALDVRGLVKEFLGRDGVVRAADGLVLLVGRTALRYRDQLERPAPGVAAAVRGAQAACVALVCLAAREEGSSR